ncbi:hypothetical protein GFC01_16555 [Desulfofundulus thermobenzoicus]|uniref:DUF1819 family protein n=1 Tax=Desulfofundulus thermobenzoicus TaxID=29376 RepID=A0A6N7IUP4_9FIRM|nr:hypothetical protein [Desulfofundulus thermobenzoicus]MQL53836.1 hypothetical protein [Desulfofundulus thermobenzoicus]
MKNDPILADIKQDTDLLPYALWEQMGFRFGDKGTHTSRTIMLEELSLLLHECAEDATRDDYIAAIVNFNCLGKRTTATRRLSSQRMRELYGLDPSLHIFRVLRYCWYADEKGRPLLALLTAMARDPLLRVTSLPILRMQPGEELARQQMINVLRESTMNRLNDRTLDKVVRNASSSWTQSGHLKGRVRKIRQKVEPTPVVTAFALLLGYLLGARGPGLFKTLWTKVLDTPREELITLAMDAKRLGFLDISYSGGIIEVSIDRMLTEEERKLIRE